MKARDLLSPDEIRAFSQKNDWAAAWLVLSSWLITAAIFAGVALWTNPFTIFLGIVLLGGRQLGLGVIMHECGHGSLFTRWSWNKFAAQWLAAAFIFNDAKSYRIGHGKHHRLGGTHEDPDLKNYVNYAVARASFKRKVRRDLSGRTGIKIFLYSIKVYGLRGILNWSIANGALWAVLYATGNGWLYLMWPAAWMTSHMLYLRIRQAAEHACVPDLFDPDPRLHTRTTYARWWEKLTVAPNNVSYHLEHHILASVPAYRLPAFHKHLLDKGLLEDADIVNGYWRVVKKLIIPEGMVKEDPVALGSA